MDLLGMWFYFDLLTQHKQLQTCTALINGILIWKATIKMATVMMKCKVFRQQYRRTASRTTKTKSANKQLTNSKWFSPTRYHVN